MPIIGRRRQGPVRPPEPPARSPETVIQLIYALSEDWGRAIRAIAIISFSLIGLFVALAVSVDIVLFALKGVKGLKSGYVITPAVFVGNWLIVFTVAVVKKSVVNSRAKRVDAGTPPDTPGARKSRGQDRASRKRRSSLRTVR